MLNTKFLEKPQDQISFVYLIVILLSVLVIYVVADGLFRDRETRKGLLFRQVGTVADLATDDVARSLAGVRDSMRLLARMPALRQSVTNGRLLPFLHQQNKLVSGTIDSFIDLFAATERFQKQAREEGELYLETATALGRRVASTIGWWQEPAPEPPTEPETGNIQPDPSAPGEETGLDLPSLVSAPAADLATPFLKESVWKGILQASSEALFSSLHTPSAFLDNLFPLGLPTLADPLAAENLLRASLNDRDLIRSVSVKQLDGSEIIGVTEIAGGFNLLSGWIKHAARAARSFYAGPVWFEEGLGRPIWNAAVPLRDEERRPFAMLSSQVDLAFLTDLAQKTRFTSTSHLLVVDEEGVVIAHPKSSLVANQVNLTKSNRAVTEVLSGEEGVRELRLGDTTFIVAFRSLKKVDASLLPGWGILYLTPLSEAFDSLFWGAVNALLLIAVSLYLIVTCAGFIIDIIEEAEA